MITKQHWIDKTQGLIYLYYRLWYFASGGMNEYISEIVLIDFHFGYIRDIFGFR